MRNCPKPLGCDIFYCSVCLGGRKDEYNEYILPEVCRRDPSLIHSIIAPDSLLDNITKQRIYAGYLSFSSVC